MIKRDFTLEIKAPVHKVFGYTTDFNNVVRWLDGSAEVTQSPPGPTRLGSTFTLTTSVLSSHIQAAGAITEFLPDQKCSFKTTSGPVGLDIALDYDPIPEGTRLRIRLEAEPHGFLKLAEGAIAKQLDSAIPALARKLKSILES